MTAETALDMVRELQAHISHALLMSLWQGSCIAGALWGALRCLRGQRASARYIAAYLALVLLVVCPILSTSKPIENVWTARDAGTAEEARTDPSARETPNGTELPTRDAGTSGTSESRAVAEPSVGLHGLGAVLTASWALIVSVLFLRTAVGGIAAHRLVQRSTPASPRLQATLRRAQRRLGSDRPHRIRESSEIGSPVVVGVLRPFIVFPSQVVREFTDEQVEQLLLHELAHIKQGDPIWNAIQVVGEQLLFFHPAAWFVSRTVRVERECACDDISASLVGGPLDYGATLVKLARMRGAAAAWGLRATNGGLPTRVARVLESRSGLPSWSLRATAVIAVAVAVVASAAARTFSAPPRVELEAPANHAEWVRWISNAVASHNDRLVLDLAAVQPSSSEKPGTITLSDGRDRVIAFAEIADAIDRRYRQAFDAPENLEDLVPHVRWRQFGAPSSFNHECRFTNKEKWVGGGGEVFFALADTVVPPRQVYLRILGPLVIGDIDADGAPEFEVNGSDVRTNVHWPTVHDHDRDRRREQWLIARPGDDPRQRCSAFVYRDGPLWVFLLDIDGDGEGEVGRSLFVSGTNRHGG